MKRAALTFDDGPNGEHTLEILEILRRHRTTACFFLVGKNVERSLLVARAIKEQGHLIGNHTYSHPHLNRLKPKEILLQIQRCESVFNKMLGIRSKYLRCPYGEYDKTSEKIIRDQGYQLVDWDRDCESRDWRNPAVDTIIKRATNNIKDGSIILLHDGRNTKIGTSRKNTIKALPDIIRIIRKRGFTITTLDKLRLLRRYRSSQ